MLNWIRNRKRKAKFEKVFSYLKELGERNNEAKRTYELLAELNFETPDNQTKLLISELNNIRFASNANTVYYFYFPIVSLILHYKPSYEGDILGHLIGPNFANGSMDTKSMISTIQGSMKFKLSTNKNFLTHESKKWILHHLPKMEKEVEREVQRCWKELEEKENY